MEDLTLTRSLHIFIISAFDQNALLNFQENIEYFTIPGTSYNIGFQVEYQISHIA